MNMNATINIANKDYSLTCAPENLTALQEAAKYLDSQIKIVKSAGKTTDHEKTLVIAALQICYELLNGNAEGGGSRREIVDLEAQIEQLEKRIGVFCDDIQSK